MGYHIVYQSGQTKCGRRRSIRLPLLTMLCFVLFLILVEYLWPQGAEFLHTFLPGDRDSVAVSALDHLAEELRGGKNLQSAVSGFLENLLP